MNGSKIIFEEIDEEFNFEFFKLNAVNASLSSDFFAGLYQSPEFKAAMVLTYMVCIFCMVGLGLVIWFERTGMAGNYRTLVNQLSTFNLDQVC